VTFCLIEREGGRVGRREGKGEREERKENLLAREIEKYRQ
jgi:hypothetical protein